MHSCFNPKNLMAKNHHKVPHQLRSSMLPHLALADQLNWSDLSFSWSVGATSGIKITYPSDRPVRNFEFDIKARWSAPYNL